MSGNSVANMNLSLMFPLVPGRPCRTECFNLALAITVQTPTALFRLETASETLLKAQEEETWMGAQKEEVWEFASGAAG